MSTERSTAARTAAARTSPRGPDPALDAALARLVAAGTLTPEQAAAVLREVGPAAPPGPTTPPATSTPTPQGLPSWTTLLAEVGGYVGAAFVVAAVAVVVGPAWSGLSTAARVATFAVPAVLLAAAAVAVALTTPGGWTRTETRGTTARRRLVQTLLVAAAGLAGGVAAVVVDDADALAFFGTSLAVLALAYAGCRGVVLHAAAAGTAAVTTVVAVSELWTDDSATPFDTTQLLMGLALLVLGVAWAAASVAGVLAERALGLFAGGVIVFVAGEVLAMLGAGRSWPGYLVLAALAAVALGAYLRLHHVALLAVGVVALAVVVPQAVLDWTDGALGAAGALLLVGLSIVGASVAGLRLRQEVTGDAAGTTR